MWIALVAFSNGGLRPGGEYPLVDGGADVSERPYDGGGGDDLGHVFTDPDELLAAVRRTLVGYGGHVESLRIVPV